MSKINVRSFSNENEDGAPDLVGITTFSATSYFVPTKGNTAQRPSDHVEVGSLRFNTDTSNLEYYRGDTIGWSQFELIDPDLGSFGDDMAQGTRLLLAGGRISAPAFTDTIEFVTISTLGDATDFGDLTRSGVHSIMYSNATRGVCHCGYQYPASPNFMNIIDFITIASTGNAQDFGDSFLGGFGCGGASQTRGVAGGGYFANAPTGETGGFTNIIDFIEIATTGNSKDFGDLTNTVRHIKGESNGHGGL